MLLDGIGIRADVAVMMRDEKHVHPGLFALLASSPQCFDWWELKPLRAVPNKTQDYGSFPVTT
jgi:hypothetical protein